MNLDQYLAKRGMRLTKRGRSLVDNLQGVAVALLILLVFGIVGSIESGRWFG